MERRYVIICTEYKGVFAGFATDTSGDVVTLEEARCAIYWATTKGIFELAADGPNKQSKIGAVAPRIELRKITAVIDVTPAAQQKWQEA